MIDSPIVAQAENNIFAKSFTIVFSITEISNLISNVVSEPRDDNIENT